jgi:hypothetical protein
LNNHKTLIILFRNLERTFRRTLLVTGPVNDAAQETKKMNMKHILSLALGLAVAATASAQVYTQTNEAGTNRLAKSAPRPMADFPEFATSTRAVPVAATVSESRAR